MEDNSKFVCYLNGNVYGKGDLQYMTQLFTDYVLTSKMYGREEVTFTVKSADYATKTTARKSRPIITPGTIQRMSDEQWEQSQNGFARLTQK